MIISPSKSEQELTHETLNQLEYYNVLDFIKRFCYSELGKEIILNTLPTDNLFYLRKEHTLIAEMKDLLMLDDQLPFEGLTDIRNLLHKSLVQNAILSPTEILSIKDVIHVSRLLKTYFKSRSEKYPVLSEDASFLHENRLLEKHIDDTIDDVGEVKDNASKELSRIRREIFEKSSRLRSRLEKILKKVVEEELAQEDFFTLREGRFVLPVKSEHKRHISGIIHGVSQTGATVFLEPSEIIEMNNELSLLLNEEKREIYRILSNLTAEIGDEAQLFLRSADIIAHLDSVMAKAKYALEFGGIMPEIIERNEIYLSNVRHPLLVHSKGLSKVIPMSVEFSDSKRGHLISGPNAGGKTVALKSIGLNVIMALSGIFPLGECKTNIRTVFSSIGDHQSIENDLSSFSSQILEIREILSNCTQQSLILIDEIGSGTDPQEGAALAAGILESFIELNLFFVATTHQSSLKTYALNRAEIENASLEFDEKKLKPTYKFMTGIPGNSYAFILAKNLGLSELVLNRAKKYMGTRQSELEESIRVLQKFRSEAEELRQKADEERMKSTQIREKYEQKYKEIKAKRKQLTDDAREEASEIIRNANALIEQTIREIKEGQRSIAEIKKDYVINKSEIEKKAQQIKMKDEEPSVEVDFKTGDTVKLIETNSIGTVLEIEKDNNVAVVDFSGYKFKLGFNQLKKALPEDEIKHGYGEYIRFDAKSKLDLRGKRAEESFNELDEFISDALVGNLKILTIIHGKGTGALRKAVHDYLKKHPSVDSFRLGDLVEGGSGVTFVELK